MVVHQDQQFLGAGAEAIRVVLCPQVGRRVQPLAARRREDEARIGHPVLDPAAIARLEMPLRRACPENPGIEALRIGLLHPLPQPAGAGERALQQRGLDPLPASGDRTRVERGADRRARREEGPEARPMRGREQRSGPRRTLQVLIGNRELRVGIGLARHAAHRALRPPALLPVQAGARGDQRIPGRAPGVAVVASVARDRAIDEPWVERSERRVVDAEPGGDAGRKALDQDVGVARQHHEGLAIPGVAQIEHTAALAALPRPVAELHTQRIASRWLDLRDLGAVVAEQHRGHRAGDAPREVEHPDTVEHAARRHAHTRPCRWWLRSPWRSNSV
ncbi:MAG: hypothetical protein CALGDGBN_03542 [Pseudomonadales bacterium]|nr:hypothetical protein [Pseudomonadales bacterium]